MDLEEISRNLILCHKQSLMNNFKHTTEWTCDLLTSISNKSILDSIDKTTIRSESGPQHHNRTHRLIRRVFNLENYKRAAERLKEFKQTSQYHRCLYYHAQYLVVESERLDLSAEGETVSNTIKHVLARITDLLAEMDKDFKKMKPDSYMLCVHGLYLLKLNKIDQATTNFLTAIRLDPLNWPAWNLLSSLVVDQNHLKSIDIPSHWLRWFFFGSVYLRLQMFEEAYDLYTNVISQIFPNSAHVLSKISVAQNELRDIEAAVDNFQKTRMIDPYRLIDMDVYSNALYVSQRKYELASLAHQANEIEPFRYESCFCLANYYSLRGQHDRAATYFSRALKFDPTNVSAWILMGHEFMEMKKTEDAIKAYRSAINLDRTDPRAWYGLGQLYEILKLPNISLENYLEAHKLKPHDTRITIALADTYEKLEWFDQALTYYRRAGGAGLSKLAPLLEKLSMKKEALTAYVQYIDWLHQTEAYDPHSNPEISHAEKYIELAQQN